MQAKALIPILRIFDIQKAREFYMGYLGFTQEWEHRFGDGFPLYIQIAAGDVKLHLTEHHGDCTPGSAVRIEVEDIDATHAELSAKQYGFFRPGIEMKPWGLREIGLTDPFGNRVVLYSR